MRWYSRPESFSKRQQLMHAIRPASWNASDHPDQVRLKAYLDDTEDLLANSRVEGPWALRLDVGASTTKNLLTEVADLDNYAYPLASRLQDSGLVSVWCTKQHHEQSFVQIAPASEVHEPQNGVLVVRTTASASAVAYKDQIRTAIARAAELPAGPVRLELAFVVGPRRNWLNLWKPTIDSLEPLLGCTSPDRDWHPRDGRLIELGMHVTVDPTAGYDVMIGIAADQALCIAPDSRKVLRAAAQDNGWKVVIEGGDHPRDTYLLPDQAKRKITVWWSGPSVLMAEAFGGDADAMPGDDATNCIVYRFDDYWTKTDRVLSALTSRRCRFPSAPHYDESPTDRIRRHQQAWIDGVAFA